MSTVGGQLLRLSGLSDPPGADYRNKKPCHVDGIPARAKSKNTLKHAHPLCSKRPHDFDDEMASRDFNLKDMERSCADELYAAYAEMDAKAFWAAVEKLADASAKQAKQAARGRDGSSNSEGPARAAAGVLDLGAEIEIQVKEFLGSCRCSGI